MVQWATFLVILLHLYYYLRKFEPFQGLYMQRCKLLLICTFDYGVELKSKIVIWRDLVDPIGFEIQEAWGPPVELGAERPESPAIQALVIASSHTVIFY
jgi:hypothetical protein